MFGKRKQIQANKQRVDLSTGGFVEIEPSYQGNARSSYIRIHLGKPKHSHDLDETYKYSHFGRDRENLELLVEVWLAIDILVRNNPCPKMSKIRRLPTSP